MPASTVIIVAGAWLILAGLTTYWLWRTRHEPPEEPPTAAEVPEPDAPSGRQPHPPAGMAGGEGAGEDSSDSSGAEGGEGGAREGGGGEASSLDDGREPEERPT